MTEVWCKSSCSTCREALRFLKQHSIPHTWRWTDRDPPKAAELELLFKRHGLMALLNPRSTAWRKRGLREEELDLPTAIRLVTEDVNLLRRPLLWFRGELVSGFSENEWAALFL